MCIIILTISSVFIVSTELQNTKLFLRNQSYFFKMKLLLVLATAIPAILAVAVPAPEAKADKNGLEGEAFSF
jgi:hypothetical protein